MRSITRDRFDVRTCFEGFEAAEHKRIDRIRCRTDIAGTRTVDGGSERSRRCDLCHPVNASRPDVRF